MTRRKYRKVKSNKELFQEKRIHEFKRKPVVAKNDGQKLYIKAILNSEIVLCEGPSGSGKSHCAIGMAMNLFDRGHYSKIIITRPAVEAGENLGFLPGDLNEKLDPYMRPLIDELSYYASSSEIYQLKREGHLEVCPLAYTRGRTFKDAVIIGDELQNCTPEQIRMLLTRIGENSKMILNGDITQSDLRKQDQGAFAQVCKCLEGVEGISIIHLSESDIVRNPIIGRILEKLPKQS